MAATLIVTGFINRISCSTKDDKKQSLFARIAYSTGRKDGQGNYPMQFVDVVLGNNLKDKGTDLLLSAKDVGDKQEHSLSKKLLNLKIANPLFSVYDGRNEGKGSYLNSEGVLLDFSVAE